MRYILVKYGHQLYQLCMASKHMLHHMKLKIFAECEEQNSVFTKYREYCEYF
jgi:hypothetical protein